MLLSKQQLSNAIPTFFWNLLVDLPQSDEALLGIVDDHWKVGRVPDLRFLIEHVASGDPDEVIPELIMTDMEWRWKSRHSDHHWDLRTYDALLSESLSLQVRARILCREFGIRNRWGDCIGRKELCERHPDLKDLFLRLVEKEIRDIAEWPIISVRSNGEVLTSTRLDRVTTAGRQAGPSQTPWSIQTSDFTQHIVLCEMHNPALSRDQLEIQLSPDRMIRIRNTSRSRALAVRSNRTAIDAGQSSLYSLDRPIRIHLFNGFEIVVHRPS